MHAHIGDHYMGAGNIGDDWMLAGFLRAWRRWGRPCTLTCATPFDRAALRRRFPEVTWLPYDEPTRNRAVAECDTWLGLGDTPFQNDTGPWMLEHQEAERRLCERHGRPRFFLCVGLNNREVFDDPRALAAARSAEHIWARDRYCAERLGEVASPNAITASADLANIYLADRPSAPPAAEIGWLLHAEDGSVIHPAAVEEALRRTADQRQVWLIQEVRDLPGSERERLAALSEAARATLAVALPDYAAADVQELLAAWPVCERVICTRYHGSLRAAWSGAKLVVVERSDKLRGLADELGCRRLPALRSAHDLERELTAAERVPAPLLEGLAERAGRACDEFFRRVLCLPAVRAAEEARGQAQRTEEKARLVRAEARRAADDARRLRDELVAALNSRWVKIGRLLGLCQGHGPTRR